VRVAGLIHDSIVDGPGLRFVVFTQGCKKCCDGCHNPDTWDVNGGTEMTADEVILEMLRNPLTDGLTLSGGEPFLQAAECSKLARAARERGSNVWIYSGFTFEEIAAMAKTDQAVKDLMELTDVLVDGRFIASGRTLSLKWRGSRNQRVINIPKSIGTGIAVELM